MRKPLSSGQVWFLRLNFPLIRGMYVLESGVRFLFRAPEVPKPRVRKSPLSLAKVTFSSLWEQALPVPKKKSTPQNGENGLVQWPTLPHIALWIVRLMLEKDCFFILKQDRNPWIKYDIVILTQYWSWSSSNIYWWFEEDKISEMEKLGLIVWRQWRLNWKSVG